MDKGHVGRLRRYGAARRTAALFIALMPASLALAACTSSLPAPVSGRGIAGPTEGENAAVECGPFARALSGVQLYGDAADWWEKADGLYARTSTPEIGSVLVFRRSFRLAHGHVGVVSAVISDREIRVTQANWVRHRVYADMPVVDLSAANDWTLVRVWWPPAGQMGASAYPAYGFIRPDRPRSRDTLVAVTPDAIRIASGAW